MKSFKTILILLVVGLIILPFLMPWTIIKPGEVGLIVRLGKVRSVVEPGFHFKMPFVESVKKYSVRLMTYETSDNPTVSLANYTDYPVDTTTKDGQPIRIKYTVRFRIDPEKVKWVYENIGTEADVVEKIIKADSRVNVRVIARSYTAEQLYTGDVKQFEEAVASVLKESFAGKGIVLDMLGIRGIDFSEDYVNAVEQKQIEKERVTAEKYKAEQEEYKKQQTITRAQAQAEAQRLLQQTLTDAILRKMWIEKWDGKLPQVVTDSNSSLLLQMPK